MTTVEECEIKSPEELAGQCQAGCRDAFELLVRQYADRIFHFILRWSGNHADAQDLTQETFLKAYRSIHRFDTTCSFTAWIFTIARNTAINHCQRTPRFDPLPEDHRSSAPDPAEQLEVSDAQSSLWTVARRLKKKQYEALWLRYGEDLDLTEIARVMRTNTLHVRVLLHRARRELARHLTHRH
ncbi:MAG TPA: sigma-70 family RNA polymerase sigma factor [Candidatus Paceibacterota bacterium]|nr:sigma-70 family RNA polymerase sigma factor [Verrucomicrobiota bacterium]HRY49305.1 sigma-70 family RNA polymerase sigma factor [Candidatus Paceibacterota bacterium]HSA01454.1 sigma-70 family RNA polymerase sigma factor [Candidatus Paceibacterota bacterium]